MLCALSLGLLVSGVASPCAPTPQHEAHAETPALGRPPCARDLVESAPPPADQEAWPEAFLASAFVIGLPRLLFSFWLLGNLLDEDASDDPPLGAVIALDVAFTVGGTSALTTGIMNLGDAYTYGFWSTFLGTALGYVAAVIATPLLVKADLSGVALGGLLILPLVGSVIGAYSNREPAPPVERAPVARVAITF